MAAKPRRFARNSEMPIWTRPGHALGARSRRVRGWPAVLAVLVLLVGATFLAARLDPLPPRFTGEGRASDGDSLRLGTDRVRLLGIDAPELDQVCWRDNGMAWPCGRAARDQLAVLLSHGPIACSTGEMDKFGRFLATCENAFGDDLGASLVVAGFALARDGYAAEESAARSGKRGLWNGRFVDPRQWRDDGPRDDPGPGLLEQAWTWLRELTGARSLR
jgi:endonuclease YncB( thermonuclease family)